MHAARATLQSEKHLPQVPCSFIVRWSYEGPLPLFHDNSEENNEGALIYGPSNLKWTPQEPEEVPTPTRFLLTLGRNRPNPRHWPLLVIATYENPCPVCRTAANVNMYIWCRVAVSIAPPPMVWSPPGGRGGGWSTLHHIYIYIYIYIFIFIYTCIHSYPCLDTKEFGRSETEPRLDPWWSPLTTLFVKSRDGGAGRWGHGTGSM